MRADYASCRARRLALGRCGSKALLRWNSSALPSICEYAVFLIFTQEVARGSVE
jgi:hypothetical protein